MLAHAFSTARTQVAPSLFAKNLGAAVWMRPFHRENPPPRQNGRGAFMRCHGCLLRCAKIQSGWRSAPTVRRYRVHPLATSEARGPSTRSFWPRRCLSASRTTLEGSGGQQALAWSRVRHGGPGDLMPSSRLALAFRSLRSTRLLDANADPLLRRSFVQCWRTRFRLPARRLRLRFLPEISVRR